MSRPFKHPKTGVYYFRKAIPEDLRAIIGKREWKVSLKTKDPATAKAAYAQTAAEVENRWKALRGPEIALTQRQIVGLAGEAYRELVESLGDEPGDSVVWDQVLRLQAQVTSARKVGDAWVITITPEAGTVKTNEAREVVLHPHLVELGFSGFVERQAPGYLFSDAQEGRECPWSMEDDAR